MLCAHRKVIKLFRGQILRVLIPGKKFHKLVPGNVRFFPPSPASTQPCAGSLGAPSEVPRGPLGSQLHSGAQLSPRSEPLVHSGGHQAFPL